MWRAPASPAGRPGIVTTGQSRASSLHGRELTSDGRVDCNARRTGSPLQEGANAFRRDRAERGSHTCCSPRRALNFVALRCFELGHVLLYAHTHHMRGAVS